MLALAVVGPLPSAAADPTTSPTSSPQPAGADATPATGTAAGAPGAPDPHDTAALVAATQALQAAQDHLDAAQSALTAARAAVAAAQEADAAAQADLDAAVLAEQGATRDLALVQERIRSHVADLGRLARTAYQSNGSLGEWSLLLGSQTPDQLTARLSGLHSVASAGNAVIARLEEDRADLVSSQSRLRAALATTRAARTAAADALAAKVAGERAAAAAADELGTLVQARAVALATAQQAAAQDRLRTERMAVQSGALAVRIRGLAARDAQLADPPHGTGQLTRPGRGVVTSPYGERYHPILHYVKLHTGIDFAVADGVVYAADDGVVVITEYNVAYGNMTVVDHGTVGGVHVATLYAHQAAFGVRPGDRVRKGQPIGVIGDTGYATGPHLHFEVRLDGAPVDPAPYLVGAPYPPRLP